MPTHGSITKAGKVRNQTPKISAQPKKSTNPRSRNRRNYQKRLINHSERRGTRQRRRR